MATTTALMTRKQFMDLLAERVKKAPTVKAAADELGVTRQFLAGVLDGKYYCPGPTVAQALGYEQVTAYRRLSRPRRKPKPAATKQAKPKQRRQSTGMAATAFDTNKL